MKFKKYLSKTAKRVKIENKRDNSAHLFVLQLQCLSLQNTINQYRATIYVNYIEPTGLTEQDALRNEQVTQVILNSEEYEIFLRKSKALATLEKKLICETELWAYKNSNRFLSVFFRYMKARPKKRKEFMSFFYTVSPKEGWRAAGEYFACR